MYFTVCELHFRASREPAKVLAIRMGGLGVMHQGPWDAVGRVGLGKVVGAASWRAGEAEQGVSGEVRGSQHRRPTGDKRLGEAGSHPLHPKLLQSIHAHWRQRRTPWRVLVTSGSEVRLGGQEV